MYNKILERNPNQADALFSKASILERLNKRTEAGEIYDVLINQHRTNPPTNVGLHTLWFYKANVHASQSRSIFRG